jgi:D-serine deaminase-like pyridoxal phosphate-dependent protein
VLTNAAGSTLTAQTVTIGAPLVNEGTLVLRAGTTISGSVRAGSEVGVLVEIDVGAGRCGVATPTQAVDLAKVVAGLPGLRFEGLQAYHGRAQHLRSPEERRAAIAGAEAMVRETVAGLDAAGLACGTIGGAGTGTFPLEAASGVWNELQAGSYIFMDADYARNRGAGGGPFSAFEHALFVMATVMSHSRIERAFLDAGLKALAFDSGMPEVWGRAGISYQGASDEHGKLALDGSNAALGIGDRLLLVPGHCDPTVNLHDWYVGVHGLGTDAAHVAEVWPVAARGAMF